MKELFQGTLEVESRSRGCYQGTRGRGWVTVPAEALQAAGLAPDQLRIGRTEDGRVVILESHGRLPEIQTQKDGRVRLSFTALRVGVSGKARQPTSVALAAAPGRVEILVPDECLNAGRAGPKTGARPARVYDGSYMAELGGLSGAARALALDAGRRGSCRTRALAVEQAVDVLRDAGRRVQQLSQRLWSLDGRTVGLADIAEAAHRLDKDAVLVAEAA